MPLLVALPLALLFTQAADAPLNVTCPGTGTVKKGGGVSGFSMSGGVSTTSATESSFSGRVDVVIVGTTGTATLPQDMLGDGRSAPRNPRTIKALAMSADLVEGDIELSGTPRLSIDRRTGALTIKGSKTSFTGQCEAFDPAKVQRKF